MCIIGALDAAALRRRLAACPVTAIMSFDSHHVVSHVVVTAIMSLDLAEGAGMPLPADCLTKFPAAP
jgi:hypothetical protein